LSFIRFIQEYVSFIRGFSRNAVLFLWCSSLSSLSYGISSVVLNVYFIHVGLSEGLLGALIFYSSIAGMLFSLPGGRASDRFGRRPVLLVSGLVYAAASVVQVAFPFAGVLVGTTLVAGASSAAAMVTGGPILVEASTASDRAHLFGLWSALGLVATVVGNALGGLLPTLFGTFSGGADTAFALRSTLYVGAALSALSVVPLLGLKESGPLPAAAASAAPLGWLGLPDRRLVARILLPQFLVGLGAGFFVPLQNVFMSRRLGATVAEIGLVAWTSSAATALGSLGSPALARRWGKVRAITFTQLASLPFLAVMGLSGDFWVYGAASLVRCALMNLATPLINTFNLEIVGPGERATVSSLIQTVWNLGWALSGYAAGWIMQHVSYRLPYAFTLVLYTVSITSFYGYFRHYDHCNPPVEHGEAVSPEPRRKGPLPGE